MKFVVFNNNKNPERNESICPVELATEEVARWMVKVIDLYTKDRNTDLNHQEIADLPIPKDAPDYFLSVGEKYLYKSIGLSSFEVFGTNQVSKAKIIGLFEHFFYLYPQITVEDPFNTRPLVAEIGKIISKET